jgi:hypothetical protein
MPHTVLHKLHIFILLFVSNTAKMHCLNTKFINNRRKHCLKLQSSKTIFEFPKSPDTISDPSSPIQSHIQLVTVVLNPRQSVRWMQITAHPIQYRSWERGEPDLHPHTYMVIKKSICTGWLQHRKLQVMFKVSPSDRHGKGGTRLTLTQSVISHSNYVIMVSDWNCLKYFCVFFHGNHQVHRDFLITLYLWRVQIPNCRHIYWAKQLYI